MPLATSSAVPDLKQAVLDELAARPALAGVEKVWDLDEAKDAEGERDVIGFIDSASTQTPVGVRQSGRSHRDENVSLRIGVLHVDAAATARDGELAAWALVDELAAAAAESAAIRAAVRGAAGITSTKQIAFYSDGLWEHRIELELTCTQARIAP